MYGVSRLAVLTNSYQLILVVAIHLLSCHFYGLPPLKLALARFALRCVGERILFVLSSATAYSSAYNVYCQFSDSML